MLTVSAVPSIILAFLFGKWQSSRHVVSVLAEEVRVKGCEFGVSSMNILYFSSFSYQHSTVPVEYLPVGVRDMARKRSAHRVLDAAMSLDVHDFH